MWQIALPCSRNICQLVDMNLQGDNFSSFGCCSISISIWIQLSGWGVFPLGGINLCASKVTSVILSLVPGRLFVLSCHAKNSCHEDQLNYHFESVWQCLKSKLQWMDRLDIILFCYHTESQHLNYYWVISMRFVCRLFHHPVIIPEEYLNHLTCYLSLHCSLCCCAAQLPHWY